MCRGIIKLTVIVSWVLHYSSWGVLQEPCHDHPKSEDNCESSLFNVPFTSMHDFVLKLVVQ